MLLLGNPVSTTSNQQLPVALDVHVSYAGLYMRQSVPFQLQSPCSPVSGDLMLPKGSAAQQMPLQPRYLHKRLACCGQLGGVCRADCTGWAAVM